MKGSRVSKAGGRERRPRTSKRAPSRLSLRVEASDRDLSLLDFCARRGGISLADVRAALERGGLYVNGKRAHNPARAITAGEKIELHLRERGEEPQAAEALGPERILHLEA